jgi:hypothetical protein
MIALDESGFDWSRLTNDHASVLEAYFAWSREHDPNTIGA